MRDTTFTEQRSRARALRGVIRAGAVMLAASATGLSGATASALPQVADQANQARSQAERLERHPSNRLMSWGLNNVGQLGVGTISGPQYCRGGGLSCSASPVSVQLREGVQSVAAGADHVLALESGGGVQAWGDNTYGQLGDGNTANSDVPRWVCARLWSHGPCRRRLLNVTAVAAGNSYSLALLSNGTVVGWGANPVGQLGDGNTASAILPRPVCAPGETGQPCRPLREVVAISAGETHAMALLRNGTVVAWGENANGQLGDGATTSSDVPVAVSGLGEVKAIAAGGLGSMALLEDGSVMAWGRILYAEGFRRREPTTPSPIAGLTGVTAIAAGRDFSLALLADGEVDSWGSEDHEEAGPQYEMCGFSYPCRATPTPIEGLGDVHAIAAFGTDSLALLNDGSVMAWGYPGVGQIGNGVFEWRFGYYTALSDGRPTTVCELSGAQGIATGGEVSLAWGQDAAGTPCPKEPVVLSIGTNRGGWAEDHRGPPGTPISISGDFFTGATAVKIGEESASFTVNSPNLITAIAPAGAVGTPYVTTPQGTNRYLTEEHFFESYFVIEE